MNVAFKIATRYVFGKKSTQAINIISAISIAGLAVGTAALILVLSVFNGLGALISGMFGAFNPDLIMTPIEGKNFAHQKEQLDSIRAIPGVIQVSAVLEELALFENEGVQAFGKIKGVDEQYTQVSAIAQHMYSGAFRLQDGAIPKAVAGLGMADKLSLNIYDAYAVMLAYAPRRTQRNMPGSRPFHSKAIQAGGIFVIQQEYDNEYIFTPLSFAQELLDLPEQISGIEIRLDPKQAKAATRSIRNIWASQFVIKDRLQQDEAFLKLQNLEKWISYIILSLTLILVSFNLVGAIWMILREKMLDISILQAMGLSPAQVSGIFKYMGFLLGLLGVSIGILLALIIYNLQIEYALVSIPDGFAVTAYPVLLSWWDVLVVSLTVLGIAYLASLPAAYKAAAATLQLKEN